MACFLRSVLVAQMSRMKPELTGPASAYYNEEQADLYTKNQHTIDTQVELTDRALDLLAIEAPAFLLEIGAGSGISTNEANNRGFLAVAVDISNDMLRLNDTDFLIQQDIGDGLNFQPGEFDGCFSISCIEWLCYSNQSSEKPYRRLFAFFTSLFCCLKPGAKAVFQFYPDGEEQIKLIMDASQNAGFSGEMIIDYPHSASAKKYYLVLVCGLTGVKSSGSREESQRRRANSTKMIKGSREWILSKKIERANRGEDIKPMSRFSGRKRHGKSIK